MTKIPAVKKKTIIPQAINSSLLIKRLEAKYSHGILHQEVKLSTWLWINTSFQKKQKNDFWILFCGIPFIGSLGKFCFSFVIFW